MIARRLFGVALALATVAGAAAGGAATAKTAALAADEPNYSSEQPAILERTPPRFPAEALRKGAHGTVVLGALLDTLGAVAEIRVLRSIPELDSAAVDAVRRWKFQPVENEGRRIPVWVHVPVRFELDAKSAKALVVGPLCAPVFGPKKYARSPLLCAWRVGDDALFALGQDRRSAGAGAGEADTATASGGGWPDSCDIELALEPTGFVRGRCPCNLERQRTALPIWVGRSGRVPVEGTLTVRRASGLESLEGLELHPRALLDSLFGPSAQAAKTGVAPEPDNGVFDDEELPEALHKVRPVYPEDARRALMSGTVLVKALIDRSGRAAIAFPQKSIPMLDAAAIASVREWTFKPATDGGKPVAVWVVIPVKFTLD